MIVRMRLIGDTANTITCSKIEKEISPFDSVAFYEFSVEVLYKVYKF